MDQPPKQSFNFTFYWQISQTGTFFHVKQPYRNPSPPQHTAPSLSFSLLAFWRSSSLLLGQILLSLYHILKCRPMVKNRHEFVDFCILLPEIVIQNSQLLTSWEQGIKHSIQGSELHPIQPWKTQADHSPWGECPCQGPRPCQPLQVTFWRTSWLWNSCLQPVQTLKDQRSHTVREPVCSEEDHCPQIDISHWEMLHWENCFCLNSCHSTFPREVQQFCGRDCPPPGGVAQQCPGIAKAGGGRARPHDLAPSLLQGQGSPLMAKEQGWMQPAPGNKLKQSQIQTSLVKIIGHAWCRIWAAMGCDQDLFNSLSIIPLHSGAINSPEIWNILFEFQILRTLKFRTTRKTPGNTTSFSAAFCRSLESKLQNHKT